MHGIGELALAGSHQIVDGELAPDCNDAADLLKQPGLVLDVHADVHHPGAVERPGFERQGKGARLSVVDAVAKPHSPGQRRRGLDIAWRQVDAGHAAATGLGEIAGWSANPATDVEDVHALAEAEPLRELNGGLARTGVELVHRRQVGGHEAVDVFAASRKGVEDGAFEVTAPIVLLDPGFDGIGLCHGASPHVAARRPIVWWRLLPA